jgi:ABC-type multidrug transport system fused ATPase/permease subunit
MSCNRWLGVRLDFFGGSIVLLTALFVVYMRNIMTVGTAGLALSTALQLTSSMGGIVRLTAMLENSLNSVERINEYSIVQSERHIGTCPPIGWPSRGSISYDNVSASYRSPACRDEAPVLMNISFQIQKGEKIGIVGRTGAGKTSLIMTLFRIIEISHGVITIDGIDISRLSLSALRAVLGIIPQDPLVFEGTIRSNIDPFGRYSDDELREALIRSHLTDLDLDNQIFVGGKNISAGQKQQICLARVILRKPKILVLDEATSSLDVMTDNLVGETIRDVFRDSTVLTIAHRLHTIVESDKIIVMDAGRIVEFGQPSGLVLTPNGVFASMIVETGEATREYLHDRISRKL